MSRLPAVYYDANVSQVIVGFELAGQFVKAEAREAIRESLAPMLAAIRGRIHSRTGTLLAGTKLRVATHDWPGTAAMLISSWVSTATFEKRHGRIFKGTASEGRKRYNVYYGRMVEYGHAGPRAAPPHPFARPGFDETVESVADAIESKLLQERT